MKILLASTIVLGLAASLYFTVEKTGKLVDESKVTYNINESKQFDGAFKIEDSKNVLRLRGSFVDNKRAGDWYCFDAAGKMVLRYNYTADKLLSLEQSGFASLDIKVIDKDTDVATNARIPVPIISVEQYKKLLEEELKDQLPTKLRSEKNNISAEIVASIDATGAAKYIAYYSVNGVEDKVSLYLKDKIFDIVWLPAKYNDKTYKSEVKFSTSFVSDPSSSGQRFIWN